MRFLNFFRSERPPSFPDLPRWQHDIHDIARPFTMTSSERLYATINSVAHVVSQDIPGAIVECGVWQGGNMLAAALTLLHLNQTDRDIYLFDTFEGMPPAAAQDIDFNGNPATSFFSARAKRGKDSGWCAASIETVSKTMSMAAYPRERVHMVVGKVEVTIPENAPDQIALLRLDTDWYESTKHELNHLYPRVCGGGIIAIDDYGHWQGARRAVDEYLAANGIGCYLHRIDYTGREFVKPNI